jgi:hypothetical protein
MNNDGRFEKMLALAVDPGAYDAEAISALRKAYELVKRDPSVAISQRPSTPSPKPAPPNDKSFQARIKHVPPSWLIIALNSLSQNAYGLGLVSKITCDFEETPTAIDVRCDGSPEAVDAFEAHVQWLLDYVNSQASAH